MNTVKSAFKKAGITPGNEKLAALIAAARKLYPKDYAGRLDYWRSKIAADCGSMAWAFIEPVFVQRMRQLIAAADRADQARRDTSGIQGSHVGAVVPLRTNTGAGLAALGRVSASGFFRTFLVNGQPLGELTVSAAAAAGVAATRRGRFLAAITENQPGERLVGDAVDESWAAKLWSKMSQEAVI